MEFRKYQIIANITGIILLNLLFLSATVTINEGNTIFSVSFNTIIIIIVFIYGISDLLICRYVYDIKGFSLFKTYIKLYEPRDEREVQVAYNLLNKQYIVIIFANIIVSYLIIYISTLFLSFYYETDSITILIASTLIYFPLIIDFNMLAFYFKNRSFKRSVKL